MSIKLHDKKLNIYFVIIGLIAVTIICNCTNYQKYDFICKNSVSIFLQNNGEDHYFSIPVQYIGDYKIDNFYFNNGHVLIGNYKIPLKRDDIKISIYYNNDSNDIQTIVDFINNGNDINSIEDYFKIEAYGLFELIFLEENNNVLVSKMDDILPSIYESDNNINEYKIFIERIISNEEIKKIFNEHKRGNVYSQFEVWYDITIDNEYQPGSGVLDDFEIQIVRK